MYRKRPSVVAACGTKRHQLVARSAAISDQVSSSWASDLPADLVGLIGWRVLASDLRDYVRFRAVCPHWRSSSACPRLSRGSPPLATGPRHCHPVTLQISRHSPPSPIRRLISSRGNLYMIDNPTLHTGYPGDTQIYQIDPPKEHDGMSSGSSSMPSQKLIATCPAGKMPVPRYLTECDSEILLIGYSDRSFTHPSVYRLSDLILNRVVPVTSIGDNVLFIDERILSVSCKAVPNIVGDSIVSIHPKDLYLVIHNLNSHTWLRAADGWIAKRDLSMPYSLIYHIFTCC